MEGEERKVVVDSSVAVKWFVEEDYTREALMLRGSYKGEFVFLCVVPGHREAGMEGGLTVQP